MSYGRSPNYIWSNGDRIFFNCEDGTSTSVPVGAIAQFITRMIARDGIEFELEKWLSRGVGLSPANFSDNFEVFVKGGWQGNSRGIRTTGPIVGDVLQPREDLPD